MAALLKEMILAYDDLVNKRSDPRVKDFPLMNSPFPILLLLIGFNYFVSNLGPKIMKNRPPLDVYYPMLIYNFVQIGINGMMVVLVFKHKWFSEGFHLKCDPVDYSFSETGLMAAWYSWVYFADKILDLLDTVFMVLRKKNHQVSFLHYYHHIAMVVCAWVGVKYVAGGHSLFFGTVNCFVHTVMYCHYQLMLVKPEYGKNMWWKKHITQLQLAQFLILATYYSIVLLNPACNFSKFLLGLFIPQNIFMFFLFLEFYKKAYSGRP